MFRRILSAHRYLIASRQVTHPLQRNISHLKNKALPHLPPQHLRSLFSTEARKWSDDDFHKVVADDKVVVFMKGTPDAPQCGFSKYVIQILRMHGLKAYTTFNVLEDDVLRSRVKEFSSWPTIPQVYMNGEFIGGFDILLQLHQSGDLIEELEKVGHRSILLDTDV